MHMNGFPAEQGVVKKLLMLFNLPFKCCVCVCYTCICLAYMYGIQVLSFNCNFACAWSVCRCSMFSCPRCASICGSSARGQASLQHVCGSSLLQQMTPAVWSIRLCSSSRRADQAQSVTQWQRMIRNHRVEKKAVHQLLHIGGQLPFAFCHILELCVNLLLVYSGKRFQLRKKAKETCSKMEHGCRRKKRRTKRLMYL